MNRFPATATFVATAALATLSGCAALMPSGSGSAPMAEGPATRENVFAATASNRLITFNAGQPGRLKTSKAITGLQPGETLLGLDFRAKDEQLYALGSSGRLYTLDTETGAVKAVGAPLAVALQPGATGFDFNPTVDRIRVVTASGQNLRLHPDTGAVVDANADMAGVQTDTTLAYAEGDVNAGKAPAVSAAAYSYNKENPKITTNFALDAATGALVTQGSREGVMPATSPNTGRLMTVGRLGQPAFSSASFDIHVVTDQAFAALTPAGGGAARWVRIDLKTGAATALGMVGTSAAPQTITAIALDLL